MDNQNTPTQPQKTATTPAQPQQTASVQQAAQAAQPAVAQQTHATEAPQQPAAAPASAQQATPEAAQPVAQNSCKCPTVNPADWDKKKTTINKTFYKAYSPRIFYYPFSFVIDLFRAQKSAAAKGYKVVENGMIIDDGAMFLGHVMVEVTGANTNDPDVLSLEGKEVYTKVSRNEWQNIKSDIADLEKELGKKPAQLFIWWTACPKCVAKKEVKSVLIALP
ncbi:MAG: hydrolase [Patescibacteria group bacterium]